MKKSEEGHRKELLNIGISVAMLIVFAALFLLVRVETDPEGPAPNPYQAEGYRRQGEFLEYEDEVCRSVKGIDVSAHQGEIDWEAVKDSGVEFAILRVGYRGTTEGHLYVDEYFEEYYAGAKAAGLQVGGYFFSQAMTVEEAEEEAAYACAILKNHRLDLPMFYDWECVPDSPRTKTTAGIPLTECCQAFCRLVESRGYDAGVYFNLSYAYHDLDMAALESYTLWLAEYNEIPTYTNSFEVLQYSDRGSIEGIDVAVDLDIMMVTKEPLK